jgi:biotin-dependent carboxylase-like uncharacterized protein
MITVLRAGLLDSVQDLGRRGVRHLGVGLAGAVDRYSLQVANRLVGNPPGAAALEITLAGARLRLSRSARIAVCGADIETSADGIALPAWRPVVLPAQCELEFGPCRRGARAYLAVDGGIDTPVVLGSRSTDLRAGLGGVDGRALRAGDELPLGPSPRRLPGLGASPWWIDPLPDLDLSRTAVARFVPLHQAAQALVPQAWTLSATSNRQGLRLQGARLPMEDAGAILSEPVAPGVVQLPPDGQPIVLLAEAQTVGGYPRLGYVAEADLPRLAQLRPGETLHFEPVTREQSLALLREQRAGLARMALAIDARLRAG